MRPGRRKTGEAQEVPVMKTLPEVFDVKFCPSCDCMTWHTTDGECEWSDDHKRKNARRPSFVKRFSAAPADKVAEPA
jgi:hypothetical protein